MVFRISRFLIIPFFIAYNVSAVEDFQDYQQNIHFKTSRALISDIDGWMGSCFPSEVRISKLYFENWLPFYQNNYDKIDPQTLELISNKINDHFKNQVIFGIEDNYNAIQKIIKNLLYDSIYRKVIPNIEEKFCNLALNCDNDESKCLGSTLFNIIRCDRVVKMSRTYTYSIARELAAHLWKNLSVLFTKRYLTTGHFILR